MRDVGRVVALVPDRTEAERTRDDLAVHGIRAELVHASSGSYEVEDETLREHVGAGRLGIGLGLLLGGLVGAGVALAVPAIREWALELRLVVVAAFALQGIIPAVMWRMGRIEHLDDDAATTRKLGANDWLVVVREPHLAVRAHHVLERHAAVFLDDEQPVQHTA